MRAASLVPLLLVIALASAVSAELNRRSAHHPRQAETRHEEADTPGWFDWDSEQGKASKPGVIMPLQKRMISSIKTPTGAFNGTALNHALSRASGKYKWNNEVFRTFSEHHNPNKTIQARHGGIAQRLPINQADGGWFCPVKVGTPAVEFDLLIDTGSADIVLADTACSKTQCGSKQRYSHSKSKTSSGPGASVSIHYASGDTAGRVYKDTFTISTNTAKNQALLSATAMSSSIGDLSQDGLGMAWPALSKTGDSPLPFSLYSVYPLFTIRLTDRLGYSYFQMGMDTNRVPGKFRTFPLSKTSGSRDLTYWQIEQNGIQVNGILAAKARFSMIFDTGTSVIIAPPAQAATFWSHVPGAKSMDANTWTFPCNTPPSVRLALSVKGYKYPIANEAFNLGWLANDKTRCVGAVMGLDTGLEQWLVGQPFLTNYAAVHYMNPKGPWIGFPTPIDRYVPMKSS